MQSSVSHETVDENVFASVGQAAREAAANATAHATADAAKVKDAINQVGPNTMKSLSNLAYSTGYVSSYGVVYAAVFLARLMPPDNAFVRGCKSGTQAALDELHQD